MILYYLFVILTLIIFGLIIFSCCKNVEINEPMEIIVARRICKLKTLINKKECQIKEQVFYKNKKTSNNKNTHIQVLRLEIIYMYKEIERLKSFENK